MFEQSSEKLCLNKAEALLVLARGNPKRCQGGTYLLRVLSNYATIGSDGGSGQVKKKNKRMSKSAARILETKGFDGFRRNTTNEHPEPLAVVWNWIVKTPDLTAEDVVRRVSSYPMVTITKDEDARINRLGFGCKGSPEERFKAAGITLADGLFLLQKHSAR